MARADFDYDGAEWVDATQAGKKYEEQVDVRSVPVRLRYRSLLDPRESWREGPAPIE
jgi:hypothetical protein